MECEVDTTALKPKFHPKFNFEDGNVILHTLQRPSSSCDNDDDDSDSIDHDIDAEQPDEPGFHEGQYFRVHESILRMHSGTFANPPSGSHETLDGIPVITIYDEVNDVVKFLKAIYYAE